MNVESMIQHAQACEHTVSRSCTRHHAVARGCRAPLHCCPSVACSPAAVMETKFFLGFEPAVGEACLRLQTLVSIRVHHNLTGSHPTTHAVCPLAPSSSILLFSCHHSTTSGTTSILRSYLPFCRFFQPNAQISRNQNCPRTDVLKSRDCLENVVTLSVVQLS